MTGSAGQKRVPTSFVENYPVSLPPFPEQTAIARYLDTKTAEIDRLVTGKLRLIELLKEERAALINEAVTKGINQDVPLKPSGVEWLGDIPAHWVVKKLKYIIDVRSGDGIKSEEIKLDGLYPVYGGNGILGYTEQFNSSEEVIIIGRVGAKCGNVRLVAGQKWISDNALVATLCSVDDINYVAQLMESLNLNSLANQNAQPLITGTLVKDKIISIPPPSEQLQIIEYINAHTQQSNATISKIEQEIKLLQEYRTALISEAVTGKIRVD